MLIFDFSAVQQSGGNTHGGGEYSKSVLKRLVERTRVGKIVGVARCNRPFISGIQQIIDNNGIEVHYFNSINELELVLQKFGRCTFYSGLPYHLGNISIREMRAILTIHGFRDLECPSDEYELRFANGFRERAVAHYKKLFPKNYLNFRRKQFIDLLSIRCRAATFVAPSLHTKYLLHSLFPDHRVNCTVFYAPPVDDNEVLNDHVRPTEDPYFLIVSGGRWIKNTYRAAKAFDAFNQVAKTRFKLLVTGGMPKFDWEPKSDFVDLGNVSRSKLLALHKNAEALIYPSLNEGFGYPPLDSLRFGVPVLASAIPSSMEVYGDALSYFLPQSVDDIQKRLLHFHYETSERPAQSVKGIERHKLVKNRQIEDLESLCSLIEHQAGEP